MPTYNYACEKCGEVLEVEHRISETIPPPKCPKCGMDTHQVILPGDGGFQLKGDGWSGKDFRVKHQMTARNLRAGAKSREVPKPVNRLVPNVEGEQTESWADAKKVAATKGKDTTSYDPLIQQEKGVS